MKNLQIVFLGVMVVMTASLVAAEKKQGRLKAKRVLSDPSSIESVLVDKNTLVPGKKHVHYNAPVSEEQARRRAQYQRSLSTTHTDSRRRSPGESLEAFKEKVKKMVAIETHTPSMSNSHSDIVAVLRDTGADNGPCELYRAEMNLNKKNNTNNMIETLYLQAATHILYAASEPNERYQFMYLALAQKSLDAIARYQQQ
jgi:hypothetical protein